MISAWNDLKTCRFWRWFLVQAFAAVGALVIILEVVGFVAGELPISGSPLATFIATISVAYGAFRAWPRPIEQDYSSPKTRVTVLKGDLFAQGCHIVVGTCDTFDTEVPGVIAKTSVQGQALERLYGGDLTQLDHEISAALSGKPIVGTIQKTGKTDRYGLGAIAALRRGPHRVYFLAYSEMNEHNEAQSTPDGIWKSLASLWEEISRTANGGTTAIPVIGGGQSRVSQVIPAQDSIRFIILSFMFASRVRKICDELRIVVREQDFDRLDRMELQAFLSSLRPS